ncbi:MAG TPA: cupin domain-containing protein [Candidatus Nanoarchaeia archaeon]|nr:cupin domain-containing protein [Candidatus Nanoarchaeia archaeon]
MKPKNIFSNIPEFLAEELIEHIAGSSNCKVERIVSKGHVTQKNKWYDQDKNEFVLIIKGNAEIRFENDSVKMKEGDYVIIPARCKHRVEKTSKETIWLAVFY